MWADGRTRGRDRGRRGAGWAGRRGRARRRRPAGDPGRPGAVDRARRAGLVVVRRAVHDRHARAAPAARARLARARAPGLVRARPGSTAPRTSGRGGGPRRTSTSRPARSGRGCTPRACGGSRSCSGPSAAAVWPPGTATPFRGSTSPGAPAREWSSRSSGGSALRSSAGWSSCASGTG